MKIFIAGSMAFIKEMLSVQKELKILGHEGIIPDGTEPHMKDGDFVDNLEDNLQFCIDNDVMRKNFKLVSESDAILVLNFKRRSVEGYIGTSVLMEMGIAHFLGKKVFLLFPTPHFSKERWAHEVAIMQPVILNNDLKQIK